MHRLPTRRVKTHGRGVVTTISADALGTSYSVSLNGRETWRKRLPRLPSTTRDDHDRLLREQANVKTLLLEGELQGGDSNPARSQRF